MWKFLILNTLWFCILLFVRFVGSRIDQAVILFAIAAGSALLMLQRFVDPVAWAYYAAFSFVVFAGAGYFRRWSTEELGLLSGQIDASTRAMQEAKRGLDEKTRQAHFFEEKADEIVEFYEQIKEMSRSLDRYETFLIFAEALSEYFQFDAVKIAFFGENRSEAAQPEAVYALHGNDFIRMFDRGLYLKERKRLEGEVYPFDQKIYRQLFKERKPVLFEESKAFFVGNGGANFAAYPIFIHNRIFAALTLIGVEPKNDPLLFILIDRFISEMQRVTLYESVQKIAITDGLTGVHVRRHLMDRLEEEVERSRRFNLKFSFLMIDIDFFKHFNDEYGHLVGDVVLKNVASTIKKNIRELDFLGRYGGEEFGVGLIETDPATAYRVAERIRHSLESVKFQAYGESLQVHVSVGCASLSDETHTVKSLVDAADTALYQAKKMGRNRVCTV